MRQAPMLLFRFILPLSALDFNAFAVCVKLAAQAVLAPMSTFLPSPALQFKSCALSLTLARSRQIHLRKIERSRPV